MAVSVQVVGIEAVQAALKTIAQHTNDTQPIMRGIANILQQRTQQSFETKTSPFGQAWKPSEHSLRQNGVLSRIASKASAYHAEIYTTPIYAAIHQFGGTIKPKNGKYLTFKGSGSRFVRVKQVIIPARPFMPVNQQGEIDPTTLARIMRYLEKKILTGKEEA